jgi:hypothetical protein
MRGKAMSGACNRARPHGSIAKACHSATPLPNRSKCLARPLVILPDAGLDSAILKSALHDGNAPACCRLRHTRIAMLHDTKDTSKWTKTNACMSDSWIGRLGRRQT